jgi:hypothetical protein
MAVHACTECGLIHDMAVTEERESDEVRIARINADRDIAVARYAARQDADWNDTRAEVARIEAKAEVQAAEIEGEVIAAALEASDVEAEPVEIIAPDLVNDVDVDASEDAPPETGEGSPVPVPEKKTSFGMW